MPQIKMCRFVLLAALFAASVSAQPSNETAARIRAGIENRDYAAAIGELETLETNDRKIYEANNYDYLLARASEKNGDFATATAVYQAVVSRNSVLSEYALWHLSQMAGATGNLLLERLCLNRLAAVAESDSLLLDAANARTTRSYFEGKNFAAAIEMLENENSGFQFQDSKSNAQKPNAPRSREDSALLGEAYLQNGQTPQAREIFARLIDDSPNAAQPDDYALIAAKQLDELDGGRENFGKIAPPSDEADHLKRAWIYQFNRNFPLARLHYKAIVERYRQSADLADALFQIGRGFAQEGNFNEAVNWFERVSAEFPQSPIAKDALAQAASAYARGGKPKVAIARYQTFIEKYPSAENIERPYLNIIDVLRDEGDDTNALKWALKTQEIFRGRPPEGVALFAQARIHVSRGDWTSALDDLNRLQTFSDLGAARVPGGTNKAEVVFLRAFALENLNRFAEAIEVYLSIPDGRGEYYGWRATERLRSLAAGEKTSEFARRKFENLYEIAKQNISAASAETIRQAAQSAVRLLSDAKDGGDNSAATEKEALLNRLREAYKLLPEYQKVPDAQFVEPGRKEILKERRGEKNQNRHKILAEELLFLGLYDEAAPELETALADIANPKSASEEEKNPKSEIRNSKSIDLSYTIAVCDERGDWASRAVSYSEPLWRNVPADYQIELLPRAQIELLYPAPYSDALLKYAPERAVDPRLLLAIMRQESRFRSDVKSYAAARGLLQFISTTGDKLAIELGRENFRQDELYNPPTAILFGAQYLSDLFRQFPNQPPAVVASYNGGEDNVLRWIKRANTTDADRYVSEIAFAQSKDYVYRVMANYRVYQMLYDEKLR